jgi:phosphoglycerate dehydrogenase-like enzyme
MDRVEFRGKHAVMETSVACAQNRPAARADLLRDAQARVIAWTFDPGGDFAEWVGFDDVFHRSDVLSIHVRLSRETAGLIRREHLEAMKPGAILINTARGGIVNESDLVQALVTNRIAGAGLDVFESKPLPARTRRSRRCETWCSRRMRHT